jgi:hypothetical protein
MVVLMGVLPDAECHFLAYTVPNLLCFVAGTAEEARRRYEF